MIENGGKTAVFNAIINSQCELNIELCLKSTVWYLKNSRTKKYMEAQT